MKTLKEHDMQDDPQRAPATDDDEDGLKAWLMAHPGETPSMFGFRVVDVIQSGDEQKARTREFTVEDTPELVLAGPTANATSEQPTLRRMLRLTPPEKVIVSELKGGEALDWLQAASAPLGAGKVVSFNAFARFPDQGEFLMKLAQDMAGVTLTPEQYALAERVAVDAYVAGVKPSVRTLAEVWGREPQLADFAAALIDRTMPGGAGDAE